MTGSLQWRNWYAPPPGSQWLDRVGSAPVPGLFKFDTKEEAEASAADDMAALGSSVRYLGAHQRQPREFILDFDKLDKLRESSEAALAWLEERDPECTRFKQAADARHARAVYYDYLKRAAPELVRLARIGAQAEHRLGETNT